MAQGKLLAGLLRSFTQCWCRRDKSSDPHEGWEVGEGWVDTGECCIALQGLLLQ